MILWTIWVVCYRGFLILFHSKTLTEKGNSTTYEWLYGEAPQCIEADDIEKVIQIAEKEDQPEEIDWDISVSEEQEIDFGITMDESGIEVESSPKDGNVARGNEALTVLDNPRTRNEFLAQLLAVSYTHLTLPTIYSV